MPLDLLSKLKSLQYQVLGSHSVIKTSHNHDTKVDDI